MNNCLQLCQSLNSNSTEAIMCIVQLLPYRIHRSLKMTCNNINNTNDKIYRYYKLIIMKITTWKYWKWTMERDLRTTLGTTKQPQYNRRRERWLRTDSQHSSGKKTGAMCCIRCSWPTGSVRATSPALPAASATARSVCVGLRACRSSVAAPCPSKCNRAWRCR